MAFLETPRFPTNINFGSPGGPRYRTAIVRLSSGHEQANIEWSAPLHEWNVGFGARTRADLYSLLKFFQAVKGRANKFRYKDWLDYKSCAIDDAITASDQIISVDSIEQLEFQLIKTYEAGALSMVRTIKKPVVGTVRLAIQSVEQINRWSVNTTTGLITLSANINKSIAAISASGTPQAQTTVAHGLAVDDSVHFSGVGGMTQINGRRGLVTLIVSPTVFEFGINTSGFSAYTTGGAINTVRQLTPAVESVAAGFEFDVPVRFENDNLEVDFVAWTAGSLDCRIMEVRVP